MKDIVESFSCEDCGAGLFYFFAINKEIHTLCRACGHICNLNKLHSDLKKERKKVSKK